MNKQDEDDKDEDPTSYCDVGSGSGGGGGGQGKSLRDGSSDSSEDNETYNKINEETKRLKALLDLSKVELGPHVSENNRLHLDSLKTRFAKAAAHASIEDGHNLLTRILEVVETDKIVFEIIATKSGKCVTDVTRDKHSSKMDQLKITMSVDVLDCLTGFAHELFHCLQYSTDVIDSSGTRNWDVGDQEFEAFLFEALMKLQGYLWDVDFDISAAIEYINHPDEASYKAAYDLYMEERGQNEPYNGYKITEGLTPQERIKHLY